MINLQDLLPETDTRELCSSPDILETLSGDEFRLFHQSVFYYDIPLFAEIVCDRWTRDKATGLKIPSAGFHKELWKEIKEPQDVLAIVARDHAKTTAVSKILVLWLLLYGVEKSILFVMAKNLGEAVVGDVRRELETNDKIKFIYGNLVPTENRQESKSEKWRQRELQLLNGTELKTITKGEAVRGLRPTKIIIDDPQERKDVRNPVLADEFYNWIMTSVYPTLDASGSMAVLGTIIASNCFANKLKSEAKEKGFKVIEYPAIIDFDEDLFTGRPLWPEKWSMTELKKRHDKIGHREFMQEYCNKPFVLNGSPVFDASYTFSVVSPIQVDGDLKYFRPLAGQVGFIGIDLASGQINKDYQFIVVRNKEFQLLAQVRTYCTQDRLAELTDKIVKQLADCVIIPENNMALAFFDACKKYNWTRKIYRQNTIDKVTNRTSEVWGVNTNSKTKGLLINNLDQLYRTGNAEVSAELKHEIEYYYYGESGKMEALSPNHDDGIMADSMCCIGIKKGTSAPTLFFM